MRIFFRWMAQHVVSLALALALAAVVWVFAQLTADPNLVDTYRPVTIEVVGQSSGLLVLEDIPTQARLTLQAPRSIWDKLNSDPALLHAWIDLTGLGPGQHQVEVRTNVAIDPTRTLQVDPERITVTLEPLLERTMPVRLVAVGNLPLGYRRGQEAFDPPQVVVSGPESAVQQVDEVRVRVDLSAAVETIETQLSLEAVDANGSLVNNVIILPGEAGLTLPVSLLGGFKNVAVKVVTRGQVAKGYRLTNILVSPPTVTLFADNPRLIEGVPGYVETLPVDLSNLVDDIELGVDLDLPEGVTVVRERRVTVQVSVAVLEGSLTLLVPIEVTGLSPELAAQMAPRQVEVIVSGPLNVLDRLTPANFRVVLDLTGLEAGSYQRQVIVRQSPQNVTVQTTLPEIVSVAISLAPPTPTPSLTPEP